MPTFNRLKGVTHIGRALLSDNLESNVLSFFDYGLLEVGGFFNITLPSSGYYGGNFSLLRPVTEDRRFVSASETRTRAWEGYRKAWVWESGLEYQTQPIQISGVYVNNVFYPKSTLGQYSHYVDYPNGRIIFGSGLPIGSDVRCEYSHRWYQFSTSDAPWFQEIQKNSLRVDEQFLQAGSGNWSVLAQNRVQLPHVVVEAVAHREQKGLALGGGQIVRQDLLLHMYTETSFDRKQILDVITYQKDKTILAFDKNLIVYPLNANGSIAAGAKTYPSLVSETGTYWNKIFFAEMRVSELDRGAAIFEGAVRTTCEVHVTEI